MRECHPTGGVLEGYASGAQGPVGALSEAREYEDRCVRSTALGSILKGGMGCIPVGTLPAPICKRHWILMGNLKKKFQINLK